ncbi:MAG: twin-arginine translocase TatA/TatE family subunit [Actinobacteria bacterium]|nr:twin-arginine translocase TatA/TatE family subunit [Actinomycetota bacterium]
MAAFLLPGGWEIWAILAVVLLLFGPTQLPKLAKMFGKSAKALKDGMDAGMKEDEEAPAPQKAAKTEDDAEE